MKYEVEEYKGHKILVFNDGSKFPTKLGIAKIKAVLENRAACEQFLKQYDVPAAPTAPTPLTEAIFK